MPSIRPEHPLRRFFAGLVEDAFYAQVGMCDPILTEYLVDLLVEFTHIDRLRAIRDVEGRSLDRVATMLVALAHTETETVEEKRLTVYRQMGDFALFWTGVYPEQLKKRRTSTDLLLDYVLQGKQSYSIVSDLVPEEYTPPASLFRHLSQDFETCVFGLGLVRRGLEKQKTSRGNSSELLF